jgi:hypothetical protein
VAPVDLWPVTVANLIAGMPKIGQFDRRAIVMLAGFSHILDDSGKWCRKSSEGRTSV